MVYLVQGHSCIWQRLGSSVYTPEWQCLKMASVADAKQCWSLCTNKQLVVECFRQLLPKEQQIGKHGNTVPIIETQRCTLHTFSMQPLSVCVCVRVCMYIYIYVYIHTYIHTYITLHYITLHYITLHYITLHYITYIYTYTYTYTYMYIVYIYIYACCILTYA